MQLVQQQQFWTDSINCSVLSWTHLVSKMYCGGDKTNPSSAQMSATLPALPGPEVCSGKYVVCMLRPTLVADLISYQTEKKSICWVNKWMWTLNSELLPADTQVCFLSCYQVQTWAVRLAVLVRPGSPTWPGWGLLSSRLIPLTGRLCLTQQ